MEDDRTLFITNIDRKVTEEVLYELFLQAGPIENIIIARSRNDTTHGYLTYKHESSVNYAIDLLKGTCLYKKELSIKKQCPRNRNDDVFDSDHMESNHKRHTFDFQEQLYKIQHLAQNLNFQQSLVNFSSNSLKGHWTSRNKPYDRGNDNYSNSREFRDRRSRDYRNNFYNHRNNRQRH